MYIFDLTFSLIFLHRILFYKICKQNIINLLCFSRKDILLYEE